MTGPRPAARMQPVVLIDADADDEDAPGSAGASRPVSERRGPGWPGARRGWRGWWPAAVAVALLVGGAAVATHVAARTSEARADAIAAVPGFVRPLDGPPVELWRAPAGGRGGVVSAGGLLVTVVETAESWRVQGHEPRSGDVVWGVEATARSRGPGLDPVVVTCPPGPTGSDVLLCRWTASRPVAGRGEGPMPPTEVLALDARDGTRLGAWDVTDAVVGLRRVEDDVVLAAVDADGRVRVERRAGTDGTVRWSHRAPEALTLRSGSRAVPSLTVAGEVVVLAGPVVAVLAADSGEVVSQGERGRRLVVGPLSGGRFATWATGTGAFLHTADGRPVARVPGVPVRLAADDGSLDVLLSDAGSRVLALDRDGAPVWRLVTVQSPAAVVDGAVLLWGEEGVSVADGADGRLLWEQRLPEGVPFAPVTDGRLVLAAEPDGLGGRALVARGLRDGVRVWSVPLPEATARLEGVGGALVARSDRESVVLGPP